jgi:[ribosomal protein S5]-alanine N-acetyltransferase
MAQERFSPIHTARLRLRPPQISDVEAIFTRYSSDVAVTRYVGWPRHKTIEDTTRFLEFSTEQWSQWPIGPLLIEDRTTDLLLGSSGLAFESPAAASTGYVLAQDSWRKGYASEALAAMVTLARSLRLTRLYALCHADHQPSKRVLERNAFALEGLWSRHTVFPNLGIAEPQDVCCYSVNDSAI